MTTKASTDMSLPELSGNEVHSVFLEILQVTRPIIRVTLQTWDEVYAGLVVFDAGGWILTFFSCSVAKMTFAYACARPREHFVPMGFDPVSVSPESITARVYDTKTGEDFAVVAGLQWSASPTEDDLLAIIDALQEEMQLQEFVHTALSDDSRVGD